MLFFVQLVYLQITAGERKVLTRLSHMKGKPLHDVEVFINNDEPKVTNENYTLQKTPRDTRTSSTPIYHVGLAVC